MFFLFIQRILSAKDFNQYVQHLYGLPPNDDNTYAVMLHTESCAHCKRLAPIWNHSAEIGAGTAIFCDLNCNENETACKELRADGVPKIFLFKNKTVTEYPRGFQQISLQIVEWISSFLEFTPVEVTKENYTQTTKQKAAILFSDKRPKSWAATEKFYNNADVKFMVSSDKELQQTLHLRKYPGVYIKNGENYKLYTGKVSALPLKEFMDKVFAEQAEL